MQRLGRDEVETFWTIDRREVHHNVYRMQNGDMVLVPSFFDVPGWENTDSAPLYACFDGGGEFIAMSDGETLVGIGVVDSILRGEERDQLQLKWLYVSRDYRRQGVGTTLFEEAIRVARARGATFLYISATPTENTVNFYLRRGCRLATPPDAELLAEEPEDIHLICEV